MLAQALLKGLFRNHIMNIIVLPVIPSIYRTSFSWVQILRDTFSTIPEDSQQKLGVRSPDKLSLGTFED